MIVIEVKDWNDKIESYNINFNPIQCLKLKKCNIRLV